MTLAFLCASLIAATPITDPPPKPVNLTQTYQDAKARAGRSPEDQVRLALWCEAHGLTAQRLHHLTLAILADPKNATARGLMGLVSHNGRWQRPEAVADKAKADPILAEYEAKRLKAAYTADAQLALGVWCEENGLKEQAKAHFTAVIRLDPKRDNAWKKLGYKKHEGRWITDAQLAAEKADAEAQKLADRKWKPLLEKDKAMLDQPSKREEAEAALASVTDPRAVASIGFVFAKSESTQARAVQLLGQIDSPAASKGLAFLAVFAKSAEARRAAAETLRGRDAREYADLLIALIRDPIKYEVKPVGGPGSPGVLFIEGKKANVKRLYAPPSTFQAGDTVKVDPATGLAVVDRIAFYETDRPNFTGRTHYNITGIGYADESGLWVDPRYSGVPRQVYAPAFSTQISPPQGAAWQHFLAQATPTMSRQQAQALASLHPQPTSTFAATGMANNALLPVQEAAAYTNFVGNLVANSPYVRFESEAMLPLGQVIEESRKTAQAAQEQLQADTKTLENYNQANRINNDRIVGVLNQATNQNLDTARQTWSKWWVDQLGYAFLTDQAADKPTIVEPVPITYQSQVTPVRESSRIITFQRVSCFGAGTPVRTIDGVRAIESLKVGDLVLTQSTSTGALGYKPIVVVHHNPPSATFRIKLGGESIISSHFHRFWVAGQGWVMARELKAGDRVRTLGGVVPVEAVEVDKVQLVYNLDIADDADFFAGQLGALVHDNTLPDPRLVPFDASTPKSEPVDLARRAGN